MLTLRHGKRSRLCTFIIAVTLFCMLPGLGQAGQSPTEYALELSKSISDYSRAASWKSVSKCINLDGGSIEMNGGQFALKCMNGNAFQTDSVRLSIDGEVDANGIIMLHVNTSPLGERNLQYEYQAFSLQEIALDALFPNLDSASSIMCSYMFLYDVYPYAMWAKASTLRDRSRSILTALDGQSLYITMEASEADWSIDMNIYLLGAATEEDILAAQENLNANYALESISTLILELTEAKACYADMVSCDTANEKRLQTLSDMMECCNEYWQLNTSSYDKLKKMTRVMDKLFLQLSVAVSSEQSECSEQNMRVVDESIEALGAELSKLY